MTPLAVRPQFRAMPRQLSPYWHRAPPAPGSKLGCRCRRRLGLRGHSRCRRQFRRSGTQRRKPIPPSPLLQGSPPTEDHHGAKPKVGVARRTRKARLRLSRLDPWSVMKTSFLFSIAAGIMLVASIYSIWAVLSTSQLFDSLNEIVRSVVSTPGDTTPFRIQEYINTQKVMGVTALIACVDVVIFTALATLGSFLYNLAATMLGGLEITLAED